MKSVKISNIAAVLGLLLVLMTVSFAWYTNNREVTVSSGTNTVKIASNGVLQLAYAVDGQYATITKSSAEYSSKLELHLSTSSYRDISGVGQKGKMYSAALDGTGTPKSWSEATVDNAATSRDSGQYVSADLYFRSDRPMEIHLLNNNPISPVTEENGKDLMRKADPVSGTVYSGTKFSQFPSGLPNLNVNQSIGGLFSRNLIASAARVAFSEYENDVLPEYPNVVYIPNNTYHLVIPGDSNYLYSISTTSKKEESYKFYEKVDASTYALREITWADPLTQKNLKGMMFYWNGSKWASVPDLVVIDGIYYPAVNGIPQIYRDGAFHDAASVKLLTGEDVLVEAQYVSAAAFAYKSSDGKFWTQRANGTYDQVQQVTEGSPAWLRMDDTNVTEEAKIMALEQSFFRDAGEYRYSYWIDDGNLNYNLEGVTGSRVPIATTKLDSDGYYYARVQIVIWVEGTDHEAHLMLNGGEFSVDLSFYGVALE